RRTDGVIDRSPGARHSAGPNGAIASPTCLELASRTPSWPRSWATASTGRTYDRNRFDPTLLFPCRPGAVHIWVPARLACAASLAVREDRGDFCDVRDSPPDAFYPSGIGVQHQVRA